MIEKRILSDQELWELLNGRESSKHYREHQLIKRLRENTRGVESGCNVELVMQIRTPTESEIKQLVNRGS